ncbi:MAG: peptide-methionine (S)-S-oxide reductase MsrA [Gammaproteobacteria bacterium]|nr:peptide-methionine (S)-S-oxide reductase MsrA [Gammaproteobacteria bacterium]
MTHLLNLLAAIALLMISAATSSAAALTGTASATQPALQPKPALQTAVFAGGCFWGVEAVFEHVRGVADVRSGYAGGSAATANSDAIGSGLTGHAEAVEVVFDPAVISYGQLLKVFFSVAHDPTQLNRQGPDRGTQYRSAIFYGSAAQQRAATTYIREVGRAGLFGGKPVVTQVTPLVKFFPAEDYHQDFARLNPNHPYISYWDAPKVAQLKRDLPDLYVVQDMQKKLSLLPSGSRK